MAAPISGSALAGPSTTTAPAAAPGPSPSDALAGTPRDVPFDLTAEAAPDSAASLSLAVIKRAEMLMIAQHLHNQDEQARLDRMRAQFDNAQARRSELLRESNALRDMALEQMKHDDEVLKKIISWI